MSLIIRRIKVQPQMVEEAGQRMENGYVSLLRSEPGFVEFYAVQTGENEGLTISVFETQEAAEEANRRALEWAKENLAPLAQAPVEMIARGEVRVHTGRLVE